MLYIIEGQVCLSPTTPVYQNKCERAKMNGSCQAIWSLFLTIFLISLYRLALVTCTMYRTSNKETFLPNDKIDNRKKKLIADRWSSYIMDFLFSIKLNEWWLQRKPRRPSFFTPGGTWQPICLKQINMIIQKAVQNSEGLLIRRK